MGRVVVSTWKLLPLPDVLLRTFWGWTNKSSRREGTSAGELLESRSGRSTWTLPWGLSPSAKRVCPNVHTRVHRPHISTGVCECVSDCRCPRAGFGRWHLREEVGEPWRKGCISSPRVESPFHHWCTGVECFWKINHVMFPSSEAPADIFSQALKGQMCKR